MHTKKSADDKTERSVESANMRRENREMRKLWVASAGLAIVLMLGRLLHATAADGKLKKVIDEIGASGQRAVKEVYPEWFGAQPDNSTDCTTAIQNTINYVFSSGGGTVYFSKGTYTISSQIQVPSYVRLVGSGMHAAFIKNTGTGVALRFCDLTTNGDKAVVYASISDMGVIGNANSSHGILIENAFTVNIDRVYVKDHGGIGIDIQAGVYGGTWGQNVFIQGCWITHNAIGGIRVGGVYRHTLCNISNNSILAGGKYLIYLSNAWVTNIIGNELASLSYGGMVSGVQPHGIVINSASGVVIEGNSFESMSGTIGGPINYIRTGFNGDTQSDTGGAASNLTITSNIFNPGVGDVDVVRLSTVRGSTIKGNFFWDGFSGTNHGFVLDDDLVAAAPISDLLENYFFGTSKITPFKLLGTPHAAKKLAVPAYGATVAIDANSLADQFKIVNCDSNAYTISNPTNFGYNQMITIIVKNSWPGMGTITWDTAYKLAGPWTNPAYGSQRAITFRYDPDGNWYEVSRSGG